MTSLAGRVKWLCATRLQAVTLIRVAARVHRRSPALASIVKYVNQVMTGCDVAAAARIGEGLVLFHPNGVVVGPDVVVGRGCHIFQHVTLGAGRGGSPTICDGAIIGPGAVVIGAVTVGAGSIVGANSVVVKSIPPGETWRGNPATFLRTV